MIRPLFVLSLLLVLFSSCQSARESEFEQIVKKAEAAGNQDSQSTHRENIKFEFEEWAKKYGVKPVEQRAPQLISFPTNERPIACDWFTRLEQNGKRGGCLATREQLAFENGTAGRACYYDCYYP